MTDRAQLKREFKETMPAMGVFSIRNKINRKIFLVSCSNLPGIMTRHRFQLQMGSHPNHALQQDWTEYGEENFIFEVLDQLKPREGTRVDYRDELKSLEQIWLDELQPYAERGYNRRKEI